MESTKPMIVCIDDEQDLLDSLEEVCLGMGLDVKTFLDAKSFLQQIDQVKPSVIVSDINMPDMDGFGLLAELRSSGIQTPFLFLTGNATRDNLRHSVVGGGFDFLSKPISIMEFEKAIRKALAFGPVDYSDKLKGIIAKCVKSKTA